jgi:hypothetical protein
MGLARHLGFRPSMLPRAVNISLIISIVVLVVYHGMAGWPNS